MTRPLRSNYGSAGLAAYNWRASERYLGSVHPATQARHGRLLALLGWVPQKGLEGPAVTGWMRESGARPGYHNRSERRALGSR